MRKTKMNKLLFILAIFVCSPVQAKVYSWSTITKHIKQHTLIQAYPTTLYSGCLITQDWRIDLSSCNIISRYKERNTIHIEHVVPASRMATHAKCGVLNRQQCRRYVPKFKACHNNRLNLFPVLSTINLFRNNMAFDDLNHSKTYTPFGKSVGLRKSVNSRRIEPPKRLKRIIGLTYLRMDALDCISLNSLERKTYTVWSAD